MPRRPNTNSTILNRDEKLIPILESWAVAFDNKHALSLGFVRDASFEEVVGDYVQGLKGV
jgi:hypothetical protein